MASGKRPSSGRTSAPRRRPPHTIDLPATEVARGPAEPVSQPTPEPTPEAVLQTPPPEPPRADPPHEPPPEPPPADPPPEPPRRPHIAWLPPDMGERVSSTVSSPLVIAGLAGAGAALLELLVLWAFGVIGTSNPAPVAVRPDTVSPRLAAIETQLKELSARPAPQPIDAKTLEGINTRLAKVEKDASQPRSPAPPDPALANRVAGVEGTVKLLADNIAALGQRSGDLVQRSNDVAKRADETVKRVDNLTAHVTKSSNDVAAALHDTRSRLDAMSASLTEMQNAVRQSAAGSDRALRVVVAASALRTAVERGGPFTAELAAVKGLTKDADTLAPLEPFAVSGVPSDAALARELSGLIQPMLRTLNTTPRDGSILDKLQANAEKLVRIRRVGEAQPGDDPAAVIARIEAKAARADIAGALAELDKLPAATRAPAQAWIAKAQARGRALAASHKLAADAIAGLNGKP